MSFIQITEFGGRGMDIPAIVLPVVFACVSKQGGRFGGRMSDILKTSYLPTEWFISVSGIKLYTLIS